MNHTFDVDVAVKYGVNAAILLQNIFWWCQKSRANNSHYYDGNYWTYNSHAAFTTIFPYLSERQVKTALEKLIEDGVLLTGNYGTDKWKRPTWYALTEKGWTMMQKCSVDGTKMYDRTYENVSSCTTDINTVRTSDNKPFNSISSADDSLNGFEDFWSAYPRKDGKQEAIKAWKALNPNKELQGAILEDIRRRLDRDGSWHKTEMRFIKMPASYLRGRRWEDEGVVKDVAEYREPEPVIDEEMEQLIAKVYERNGADAWM